MGCDIHMYAEKRNEQGKWEIVGNFSRDKEEGDYPSVDYQPYSGRNYNLFAILADVRNGRGFAGCKTGEGFNPICEPKGVPSDASEPYLAISKNWDSDGHSHSHFTLRELLDYDWTQETQLQGWVDMVTWEHWSRWDKKGAPESSCGGIGGKDIEHITAEEADKLFDGVNLKDRAEVAKANANKYAIAQWGVKYSECASRFLAYTIPDLLKLAGGTKGLDDIRIVFFFDN